MWGKFITTRKPQITVNEPIQTEVLIYLLKRKNKMIFLWAYNQNYDYRLASKKNYMNVKNTFWFSACTSQKSSHPRVLGDFLLGFLKTWCFIFLSFFLLLSIILPNRIEQKICKSADKILCFILIKHQLPRLMVLVLQPLI